MMIAFAWLSTICKAGPNDPPPPIFITGLLNEEAKIQKADGEDFSAFGIAKDG